MRDVEVMIVDGPGADCETSRVLAGFIGQYASRFREPHLAVSLSEALSLIPVLRPNLLFLNNCCPQGEAAPLLKDLVSLDCETSVIFMTTDLAMENCARAIRLGAFDYLILPLSSERLMVALEHYLRFHDSLREQRQITQSHIDALFNLYAKNAHRDQRVKNIEELTLRRIRELFDPGLSVHTSLSVARAIDISMTTARRYLAYCAASGFLSEEVVYGRVGRPERIYKKKLLCSLS